MGSATSACRRRRTCSPTWSGCAALVVAANHASLSEAALNIEQELEDSIYKLRDRVFVADALLWKAFGDCDSSIDGPHCTAGSSSHSRLLASATDGLFSSRLFSNSDGTEMLHEFILGSSLKSSASSGAEVQAGGSSSSSRGRSALLSFRGIEPWQASFPFDFSGSRRLGSGIPFRVEWEGRWNLVDSPVWDGHVVREGQFVAELQGAVGRIRFGRPVNLQAIDLARPPRRECLTEPESKRGASAQGRKPGQPLLIIGRRRGKDVFSELVPSWEMQNFVNGVAFFALTATDVIDEVVFLLAECLLVGVVQVTFGSGHLQEKVADDSSTAVLLSQASNGPLLLSLREGWHATGYAEIELRVPSPIVDAPLWSLNDIVQQRLTLRPGVFDADRSSATVPKPGLWDPAVGDETEEAAIEEELLGRWQQEKKQAANMPSDEVLPEGDLMFPSGEESGPREILMPSGMEEVVNPENPLQELLDTVLAWQRNSTVLDPLLQELMAPMTAAQEASASVSSELLRGVSHAALNNDLVRLAAALVEALEVEPKSVLTAASGGEAVDTIWRGLGLDYLDSILLRWEGWRQHEAMELVQPESGELADTADTEEDLAEADLHEEEATTVLKQGSKETLEDLNTEQMDQDPVLQQLWSELQQSQLQLQQTLSQQVELLQQAQRLEAQLEPSGSLGSMQGDAEPQSLALDLLLDQEAWISVRLMDLVRMAEALLELRISKRRNDGRRHTTTIDLQDFGSDERYQVTFQAVQLSDDSTKELSISIRDSSGRQVSSSEALPLASAEELMKLLGNGEGTTELSELLSHFADPPQGETVSEGGASEDVSL